METNPMLQVLSRYTHASRTNAKKLKLTNHDATLLLLIGRGGKARLSELINDLRTWRPLTGTQVVDRGRWVYDTNGHPQKFVSKRVTVGRYLHFTYLFNACPTGGYGFVGDSKLTTTKSVTGWTHTKDGIRDFTTQRRTFWYRKSQGVYAVTLEGLKRLTELRDMGIAGVFKGINQV